MFGWKAVIVTLIGLVNGGIVGSFAGVVLGLIRVVAGEQNQNEGILSCFYYSVLEGTIYGALVFICVSLFLV